MKFTLGKLSEDRARCTQGKQHYLIKYRHPRFSLGRSVIRDWVFFSEKLRFYPEIDADFHRISVILGQIAHLSPSNQTQGPPYKPFTAAKAPPTVDSRRGEKGNRHLQPQSLGSSTQHVPPRAPRPNASRTARLFLRHDVGESVGAHELDEVIYHFRVRFPSAGQVRLVEVGR